MRVRGAQISGNTEALTGLSGLEIGVKCMAGGCLLDFPSPSQVVQQRGYPPFRGMFPESSKTVFESLFWYRSQGEKAWHDERFGNLKPDTS